MAHKPDYTRDFGITHKGTADQYGHAAEINGVSYRSAFEPPRGHCAIEDDGTTRFYLVSRKEAGAFRRWASGVFCETSGRLRGSFPSYWVEG